MHHDHLEALHTIRDLGLRLKPADVAQVDVSVHPPFTDLRTVQTLVEAEGIPVALGAQHCNEHDRGAYTGEVSPQMLARLGVRYVLVGHSERRRLFAMSDEQVAATVAAVLRHEMVPVLCVGESEEERQAGRTTEVLEQQLRTALEGVKADQVAAMVVAYEPIWAIGAGQPATPEDAQEGCGHARSVIEAVAGPDAALGVRVQYGGSVDAANAAELVAGADVDGLLVGGASLEAARFVDIVRALGDC